MCHVRRHYDIRLVRERDKRRGLAFVGDFTCAKKWNNQHVTHEKSEIDHVTSSTVPTVNFIVRISIDTVQISFSAVSYYTSPIFSLLLDWIEQRFTSPPTQYRLYRRRIFSLHVGRLL